MINAIAIVVKIIGNPMIGLVTIAIIVNGTGANHQPLLLVSCKRLTATDIPGKKTNKVNEEPNINPTVGSPNNVIKFIETEVVTVNKTHHQYSEREARPEKVAYFLKQVFIDSINFILVSPFLFCSCQYSTIFINMLAT